MCLVLDPSAVLFSNPKLQLQIDSYPYNAGLTMTPMTKIPLSPRIQSAPHPILQLQTSAPYHITKGPGERQ